MRDRPLVRRTYDVSRGTSGARGYDRAWKRCRDAFLHHEPLCRRCLSLGIVTAAREVHHVEPIESAPDRRLDWTNLMPVCHPCHMTIEADAAARALDRRAATRPSRTHG